MAATARKFEMEPQMSEHTVLEQKVDRIQEDVSVLKADVTGLKEDVSDLKADVRRLDTKIDAVNSGLVAHRLETEKSFGTLRTELTAAIGTLRVEMKDSFANLRSSHIAQIAWMVSTVIAATGAAVTVAKFYANP